MTGRDIATQVLLELNINDPVNPPDTADLTFVMTKANRVLDNWNADRRAVYGDQFLSFTITPNLNPHTIGLAADTPTWTVTGNRPESIEGAVLVLNNSTPNARVLLTKRDAQWWEYNQVPTVTSSTPTDFFFNPAFPLGQFYLWPVPTVAYVVQLWVRAILAQLTVNSTFELPPGYWDALVLTTAEDCCGPFQKPMPPMLPSKAAAARNRIFGNNTMIPKISTSDAGMPKSSSGGGLPDFFWPTGSIR